MSLCLNYEFGCDQIDARLFNSMNHQLSKDQITFKHIRWLKWNLPIFYQVKVDVEDGNGFIGVFASINHDRIDLSLLFRSESEYNEVISSLYLKEHIAGSYSRSGSLNYVATCFYRSWNRIAWGRTFDINHLRYEGVQWDCFEHRDDIDCLEREQCLLYSHFIVRRQPFTRITTRDASGQQTFVDGSKRCFGCKKISSDPKSPLLPLSCIDYLLWFSLFFHYQDAWAFDQLSHSSSVSSSSDSMECPPRPLLWINTQNHMMSATDTNPQRNKLKLSHYPIWLGSRYQCERICQLLPQRWSLLSLCCSSSPQPVEEYQKLLHHDEIKSECHIRHLCTVSDDLHPVCQSLTEMINALDHDRCSGDECQPWSPACSCVESVR